MQTKHAYLNKVYWGLVHRMYQSFIGNGSVDCSCKGAVVEEVQSGNLHVIDEEKVVSDLISNKLASTGTPLSACFSRNV